MKLGKQTHYNSIKIILTNNLSCELKRKEVIRKVTPIGAPVRSLAGGTCTL